MPENLPYDFDTYCDLYYELHEEEIYTYIADEQAVYTLEQIKEDKELLCALKTAITGASLITAYRELLQKRIRAFGGNPIDFEC